MNTFDRLQKLLAASLDIPQEIIKPGSTLDDLFWEKRGTPPDSMDIVELMMGIEEELGFEVPDDEIRNLSLYLFNGNTTIQQMADLIDKQSKGNAA